MDNLFENRAVDCFLFSLLHAGSGPRPQTLVSSSLFLGFFFVRRVRCHDHAVCLVFSCYARLALAMPTLPPCYQYMRSLDGFSALYLFGESSLEFGRSVCIHVLGKTKKRRGKIGFSSANELVHVFPASL